MEHVPHANGRLRMEDSDVVFIAVDSDGGNHHFRLHKAVLYAASLVFQEIVENGVNDGPIKKVTIDGVEIPTLKLIMEFIYRRKTEFNDVHTASRVAVAAKRFKLCELYRECICKLIRLIDGDSIPSILESSYQLREPTLNEALFNASVKYLDHIKSSPSLGTLSVAALQHFAQNMGNLIKPKDMFYIVYDWAKTCIALSNGPVTAPNIRDKLEPILSFVKFLQLSTDEFEEILKKTDIFNETESKSIKANLNIVSGSALRCLIPSWCNREVIFEKLILVSRNLYSEHCGELKKPSDSPTKSVAEWYSTIRVSENCSLKSVFINETFVPCSIVINLETGLSTSVDSLDRSSVVSLPQEGRTCFYKVRYEVPQRFLIANVAHRLKVNRLSADPTVIVFDRKNPVRKDETYQFDLSSSDDYQQKVLKVEFLSNDEGSPSDNSGNTSEKVEELLQSSERDSASKDSAAGMTFECIEGVEIVYRYPFVLNSYS